MGGKLGLNRKIFDQELKQAEAEAEEQKIRVVTNVRMSYIQALAAQQTLEKEMQSEYSAERLATNWKLSLSNLWQALRCGGLEA